jgi:hypothetical protein
MGDNSGQPRRINFFKNSPNEIVVTPLICPNSHGVCEIYVDNVLVIGGKHYARKFIGARLTQSYIFFEIAETQN